MECSICLGKINNKDGSFFRTACNHRFHHKCIIKWLVNNSTCPYCRENIYEEDSKKIEDEDYSNNYSVCFVDNSIVFDDDYEPVIDRLFDIMNILEHETEVYMNYKWFIFYDKDSDEVFRTTIYKKKYNILVDISLVEVTPNNFVIEIDTKYISKIDRPKNIQKFKFKNRNIRNKNPRRCK
jgi:hypothetical protein